jgi:hypothetical protein
MIDRMILMIHYGRSDNLLILLINHDRSNDPHVPLRSIMIDQMILMILLIRHDQSDDLLILLIHHDRLDDLLILLIHYD